MALPTECALTEGFGTVRSPGVLRVSIVVCYMHATDACTVGVGAVSRAHRKYDKGPHNWMA